MMRRFLWTLLALALLSGFARAQPITLTYLCTGAPTALTCNAVTAANPLPVQSASGLPSGATAVTASATGTTAATTATLAANASLKTWICGFQIGATVATTAVAGNSTVTGVTGGTLNFETGSGVSPAVVQTQTTFSPCLPSSATNTAVAVVSLALGTGGVISVTAWGYQQ